MFFSVFGKKQLQSTCHSLCVGGGVVCVRMIMWYITVPGTNLKFEYFVVSETHSDKVDIGHFLIKVRVSVGH